MILFHRDPQSLSDCQLSELSFAEGSPIIVISRLVSPATFSCPDCPPVWRQSRGLKNCSLFNSQNTGFQIAHLKALWQKFLKDMLKLLMPFKFWVIQDRVHQKECFTPLYWKKSLFWPSSTPQSSLIWVTILTNIQGSASQSGWSRCTHHCTNLIECWSENSKSLRWRFYLLESQILGLLRCISILVLLQRC